MNRNKSLEYFLLFGRTCIIVEDIPDEDFVDALWEADAFLTTEHLTPQEIVEKYGEILTKEQVQLIYGRDKI